MDKETHKKLTANFPKSVVKKAPQGKYGDYVPHHIYTRNGESKIWKGNTLTLEN